MKKWLDKYDTNGSLSKYPWGGPAFDPKKIQEALDQYNKMKIGYPYPLDAYQKKEVTDQDVTNYEAYMSGDKANKNYFYETHELVKNSDGTQSWKVKDDVNYNEAIKGTPLGQFIYKQGIKDKDNKQIPTDQFGNIYTDYTGLEMGYSPYNLWTSPTSGISLYNDNPNNILKQLDFVPDVYPTIYFLGANNPIKEGEGSLWDGDKISKGSFGFNESILGSGLADQGYSTLNLGDSFRDLDKLKGKYKETFGYGDDLLRVVDPTDYNVMGALQLTPEIVEYLKNLESELPDYKFDPYANRKQRAAFNQDELLKAVEGERTIKEYLLKQAGIDPALGMQYLMHYNYTPLDVYSEINNPSALNYYNQIGAVKNKFQDISYDRYTNDPEYKRLLDQFLDENKVVRKKGGSTKWLDRYDTGGPKKPPVTAKVDLGDGKGVRNIDIASDEYRKLYPNLVNSGIDPATGEYTLYGSPMDEVVVEDKLPKHWADYEKFKQDYIDKDKNVFRHWYDKLGYDRKNVEGRAERHAYDKVAKDLLDKGADNLTPGQLKIVSNSAYANKLDPSIWQRFSEGVTNPGFNLETLGNFAAPLEYPGNLVRGLVTGDAEAGLKGEPTNEYFRTDNMAAGYNPQELSIANTAMTIGADPSAFTGEGIFNGIGSVSQKGAQVFTPALKNFATNLGDYVKYGHNYKNIRNYVNEGFPAANTTPKITTFRNPKTGRTEVYQYDLADKVIPTRSLSDVKRKFKNLRRDLDMPYADYLLGKYIPGASHPISLAKDAGIVIDPTTGHLFDSNTRAWMNLTFGKENPILEHPVDVLGRSFGKKLFDVNSDGSLVYPNTPKKLGGSVLQKQKKGGQKNAAVEYYDYIRYK